MKNSIIAVTAFVACATCLILAGCDSGNPLTSGAMSQITIDPTSAPAGSPDLQLTITGSGFVTGNYRSEAVWVLSGLETPLATTFVSASRLTAIVPAQLMTSGGNAGVFVRTTGGPQSTNAAIFRVSPPPPKQLSIVSISPTSVPAGSPNTTLTVTGSNFVDDNGRHLHSYVEWQATKKGDPQGMQLRTTVVSSSEATAVIPATLLVAPIHATISIQNWYDMDCGPSAESNSVDFDVN